MSTTLTYIIIDDEPLAREGIRLNADKIPSLQYIGEFGNAIEASNNLTKLKPDILFLDIEMPGISGLEFLETIQTEALVILTTAYPQYALEAFELNVVDYLVKPIRIQRFFKAVKKAEEIHFLRSKQQVEIEWANEFVYIKSDRKYVKLFLQDVLFIKGLKDYVIVHTKTAKYMTAMNIKRIFDQLPKDIFARVSKSYLINVEKIESIELDLIWISGEDIPLGPSYKQAFLEKHVKSKLIDRK